jgi:hypothetical protein
MDDDLEGEAAQGVVLESVEVDVRNRPHDRVHRP